MNEYEGCKVDWKEIASKVGSLQPDGSQISSTRHAQDALEVILGKEFIHQAVDYYVSAQPGSELARSVLWRLKSWTAMQRCHEIYEAESEPNEKASAIELLRVCSDHRVLPWISRYLTDEDESIQLWGAGVVDQLIWSELVEPDDCQSLLAKMKTHSNENVRERYDWIMSFLEDRKIEDDESTSD